MQKKVWIGFIALITLVSPLFGQTTKRQWVDSVFTTLDLYGKIGQILMVQADSYADKQTIEKITTQIKRFHVGGIVFTKGGPVSQIKMNNYFQQQAGIPLLIGMNAESGLGDVLDSTLLFPPPMMLGSIQDDSLMFFLGSEIGKQLKTLGVHINFGPTSDLHVPAHEKSGSNPMHYYGEDQNRVAAKLVAYQQGIKSENILSVAKRSPDYGLVVKNVHIQNQAGPEFHSLTTDPNHAFPLTQLVQAGTDGVLTTYEAGMTFSGEPKVYNNTTEVISRAMPLIYSGGNIKRQLNFNGLVFSFIPTIQLKKKLLPNEPEIMALKAGSDVLLFPENVGATVRRLRKVIRKDKVLQKQLDESVKKILATKYDAGLHKKNMIRFDHVPIRTNKPATIALQTTLLEKSVVVVKDDRKLLPLQQLDNKTFASVSIGANIGNTFAAYLSKYTPITHYALQAGDDIAVLAQNLSPYDYVIVGIFQGPADLGNVYREFLRQVGEKSTVIVVLMDSPSKLAQLDNMPVIIQAYSDLQVMQQFLPQVIFGAARADGSLPLSVGDNIKVGAGTQTCHLGRLSYSTPELEGLDSKMLSKVALVAQEAIEQKAAPGCQVLIARHGKIIYDKCFGAQTYDNKTPVTDQTIYDLASVSKVMGTLQVVMFLQEKGLIDIYKKVSVYLPELLNTNKKDIIIKDVLTHQSGLAPFLMMWPQTVKGDTLLAHYYAPMRDDNYPLQVAPGLYASTAIQDSVWHWLLKSDMLPKPPRTPYGTRYSDLGFMIMHRLVERIINQPINEFLNQNLYEPLGSGTVGYLPLTRFPAAQIAPTEIDTTYRKTTIVGTVHDERAAMLGGVAGHAGLFGNASDLIKLGQMLLQKGSYGGQSFYKPATVELFAQKQFENSSRGLGWAKPGDTSSPSSRYESPKTFGHTGFTGTCIWMDPEFDVVFVFLSNSRFPNRSGKLNTTNIRSRIQDTIYQSIFNFCQYGENEPDRKLMEYLRKTSN
jgi:beta-N-acetylhexosaminidase